MKKNHPFTTLVILTFVLFQVISTSAQDWPEFLGAGASAKSSDRTPTTWSEKENLLWKLDLPGSGSSSPIVIGERVFVTCFHESKKSVRNSWQI